MCAPLKVLKVAVDLRGGPQKDMAISQHDRLCACECPARGRSCPVQVGKGGGGLERRPKRLHNLLSGQLVAGGEHQQLEQVQHTALLARVRDAALSCPETKLAQNLSANLHSGSAARSCTEVEV